MITMVKIKKLQKSPFFHQIGGWVAEKSKKADFAGTYATGNFG
jgi:hypothetical protein